jgi:hypothetical protein
MGKYFPESRSCRATLPGKIITLINIAIKRLLISGYPAGYLMGACPGAR